MDISLKRVLLFLMALVVIIQLISMYYSNINAKLSTLSPSTTMISKEESTINLFETQSTNEIQANQTKEEPMTKPIENTTKPKKKEIPKKKLNPKKVHQMAEDFLMTIDDFANKFDSFRLALRNSNPFAKWGYYDDLEKKLGMINMSNKYNQSHYGLINDPNYCEISDLINLYDPTTIMNNLYIFTDYETSSKIRTRLFKSIGIDTMPEIAINMDPMLANEKIYLLNSSIALFFTKDPEFHNYHEIGRNFLCSSQIYNHIPGANNLNRLDLIINSLEEYNAKFGEMCKVENVIYPKIYKLEDQHDCEQFFSILDENEDFNNNNNNNKSYLYRINYNSSNSTIFELGLPERQLFQHYFNDNNKCQNQEIPIIVQEFLPKMLNTTHYPLIRTYMLIASTDPLIMYYHDGNYIELPAIEYRSNPNAKYDAYEDMHQSYTHQSYEKLEEVLNQGLNTEQKQIWIENAIRKSAKRLMIQIVKQNQDKLFKFNGVFELFAIDFVISQNNDLILMDVKPSPKYLFNNLSASKFHTKLIVDMIEIEYAYLRSRIANIRSLMPEIHANIAKIKNVNLSQFKKKFTKLNSNGIIHQEFELSPNNSFQIIFNESKDDITEACFGLIEYNCLV